MSTEVDFDRRGEPPQLESVRLRDEERRLSEIHLARATFCIQASSRTAGRKQMPAGLPANISEVNASIWKSGTGTLQG
jgi:hypothetical protein